VTFAAVTFPAALLAAAPASADAVGLTHYLVVSALVFGLGILVILTRRNAIAVLMGLELLLNAGGLNFVAFSKYASPDRVDGQIVTLFVIVIAAAEASLALAITLNIFNNLSTIEIDEASQLKG
jgi:NADH-quinone oxidoreductase subunit K